MKVWIVTQFREDADTAICLVTETRENAEKYAGDHWDRCVVGPVELGVELSPTIPAYYPAGEGSRVIPGAW